MSTRAHHAQLLLDNPVFQDLLEEINKGINREMDNVKPNDIETMKYLIASRQVANKMVQYIVSESQKGKVEAFNARRKRKLF